MRLTSRRHRGFIAAFGLGILAGLLAFVQGVAPVFCLLSGVNLFFLLYLGFAAARVRAATAPELRRHAAEEDEGVALILFLALVAVVASITAILVVLNHDETGLHARLAALASLPLGWATVHVLAAFHYAHLHYRGPGPGMAFPGKGEPEGWDFLYASFTIGMTAQVSDVEVQTRAMRQAVLVHGIASFFYNTGILALAVNAAVTAGG
jgi:uncharacterized membrane protein